MVGTVRMILVATPLRRILALVMAMISSRLLVLQWTRRKSAHRGAVEGKKPTGIKDREHRNRHYKLLMT